MKKLMMAVAIVCATACAQAGYVKWSMSSVMEGGEAQGKGSLYLFDSASIGKDSVGAAILAAYADNGAASLKAWLNENALGKEGTAASFSGTTVTVQDQTVSNWGHTAADVANGDLGLAGSTSYTLYGVIFDDDTLKGGNFYVTTSATQSTKGDSAGTSASWSFGDQSSASSATGAWTKLEAVPEPTSGLLLLLGVAGLALRRRRA